jgi:hypothetical protein
MATVDGSAGLEQGGLPPDEQLVAQLRRGDEAAFAALLDAWSHGMLWAARALVRYTPAWLRRGVAPCNGRGRPVD